MHGQVLELDHDYQPKQQSESTDNQPKFQQPAPIDAAKLDARHVGQLEVGFTTGGMRFTLRRWSGALRHLVLRAASNGRGRLGLLSRSLGERGRRAQNDSKQDNAND